MAKTLFSMLLQKLEEEAKKASKKSSTPIIKKEEEKEEDKKAFSYLSTENKPSIYTDTPKQGLLGTVKNSTETTVNLPKASQVISAATDTPAADKPVQKDENAETISEASQIKDRVASALEKKYGAIDTKAIFDSIDDDTVERNIDVANASIKTSLKNGSITNGQFEKLPNMRDGLTLFYAASEKGNKAAANMAYKAAYTEEEKNSNDEQHKIENYSNSSFKLPNFRFLDIIRPKYDSTSFAKENGISKNRDNYNKTSNVYYGVGVEWDGQSFEDLEYGDYSKEKIIKTLGISEKKFQEDVTVLEKKWKSLALWSSTGKMETVLCDMIDHFMDGTGTDYSNEILTEQVSAHKTTKKFMSDFSKVFDEYVKLYNGAIVGFANGDDFKGALREGGVLLSKYAYDGLDKFTGLTLAIHGWTTSEVNVKSFNINKDGTYEGTLEFIFADNFGLDSNDIDDFYGLDGFQYWFILQHYDKFKGKYKPFRTVVKIDYPISGQIK